MKKNIYDQFYTNVSVSKKCFRILTKLTGKHSNYMEPSAGSGSLYRQIYTICKEIYAYDIDPKQDYIIKRDFLKVKQKTDCIFGNPPFGKRSLLAIKFFNHACNLSSVIAFIVPVQFRKWSVQNKLNKDMILISDTSLPPSSFLLRSKPYSVRCCFQIWIKNTYPKLKKITSLRLKNPPIIFHNDFKLYQYNNTKQALKVFDNVFDFAVPRQGYQDYSRRETNKDNCEKNKQWLLVKASNKKVLNRLLKINFNRLSKNNTSIPGFGKADLINLYNLRWKA